MAKRAKKRQGEIGVYRHEADKRKNAVPVGFASYDTAKTKPKKYEKVESIYSRVRDILEAAPRVLVQAIKRKIELPSI